MSEDPLVRMGRGASRLRGVVSGLLGQEKKSTSLTPRKRSRKRRKKVSGSETYRSFLKERLK